MPSPSTWPVTKAARAVALRLSGGPARFMVLCLLAGALLPGVQARAEEPLGVQAADAFANGDYERAVELADEAFRTGVVSRIAMPTTLAIRAMGHANLGDAQAAWSDIDAALQASTRDFFVYYGGSVTALLLDEPHRGLFYANTAVRMAPGAPRMWQSRADLLEVLGYADLAEADRARARVLEEQPGRADHEETDAREDCFLGLDLACGQGLHPLVMEERASPGTAALLGYQHLVLGFEEDGREFLRWSREAHPQALETWLYVGLTAYRDGDNAAARDAFLMALAIDPLDLRAGLGLIAATPGDRRAAVDAWQRQVTGLPLEESQHAIFALQGSADWSRAAEQSVQLYRANVGPFVMLAVALLADDGLDMDRRKQLLTSALTPQRYMPDLFTRYLATLERERLHGS